MEKKEEGCIVMFLKLNWGGKIGVIIGILLNIAAFSSKSSFENQVFAAIFIVFIFCIVGSIIDGIIGFTRKRKERKKYNVTSPITMPGYVQFKGASKELDHSDTCDHLMISTLVPPEWRCDKYGKSLGSGQEGAMKIDLYCMKFLSAGNCILAMAEEE